MPKKKNNPNKKWFEKFSAFTDEFGKAQLKLKGKSSELIGKKSGEQDEVCFAAIYTENGEDCEIRLVGQSSNATKLFLARTIVEKAFEN